MTIAVLMSFLAGISLMLLLTALILLLAVLLLLLAALLFPLHYLAETRIANVATGLLQLRYACLQLDIRMTDFHFSREFRIFGRCIRGTTSHREKRAHKPRSRRRKHRSLPGPAFLSLLRRYLADILQSVRPREIFAAGTYSLDDPADTALLAMLAATVSALLPRADIALQPSFGCEPTDVSIRIAGRIVPIVLVWLTIRLLFRKEVRGVVFGRRIPAAN